MDYRNKYYTITGVLKAFIILWVVSIIFISILLVDRHKLKERLNVEYEQIDTIYNKIILDSISYNIEYRDSIIYDIKQKIIEDEKQIISLNDSLTIQLFFKLVGADN